MVSIPAQAEGSLNIGFDGFAAPLASNEDLGKSIIDHLPRGPAWDAHKQGGESTVLRSLLCAAGREFSRLEKSVQRFLAEAVDPREAFDLLGAWEIMLGLPECGPLPATIAGRRADAYAKLTTRLASLNELDFIAIAALLGYTITINEFYDDALKCDEPLDLNPVMSYAEATFCWQVDGPTGGDDGEQDDEIFKCKFGKWVPAHTCVVYNLT